MKIKIDNGALIVTIGKTKVCYSHSRVKIFDGLVERILWVDEDYSLKQFINLLKQIENDNSTDL